MSPDLLLLSRVAYRGREITGPRVQALIALLAADLRSGCGVGRLVQGLWPDESPDNPPKALQILVSRARSQLGADAIARTPTGYRLTLPDDQVDTTAVQLHAAAAARAERNDDPASALSHAESGLALYDPLSPAVPPTAAGGVAAAAASGGPAGGAADGAEGALEVLRAQRVSTFRGLVRARALALARLGRVAEAAGPLGELAAAQPRDEEVLRELLRCEAATMGPATALARYDTYRRALRDDLGTDPGPALQAEYERLLRGTAPTLRRGVIHEPNPLLGRDDDVTAVEALLRSSRVTSVLGPGGLGKTRLANAVARRATFPTITAVPLAGLPPETPATPVAAGRGGTSADDVAHEIAAVLGAGEARGPGARGPAADPVGAVVAALAAGPALLVLDNCEHVVGAVADVVATLVAHTGELRILTTSRTPLGLSSEAVYHLPELDRPTSVELFEQRARAARPNAELPSAEVREICDHLDGLPLAIELAAARVRIMPVADLAKRLDDRFALLRGGTRDTPARHHTLRAVVDWSWNLLETGAQDAMRALSIFPDGFTTDAAAALGVSTGTLERLADHSLLEVTDTRLRMLETVREFSAQNRPADVAGHFLTWARHFGAAHSDALLGPDPYATAATVHAEHENLLHALRLALAHDDRPTTAAVTAVLSTLWTLDSNYTRLTTLIEQTSWPLSHYRPEPELVEATRTALTMSAAATFGIAGARPVRSLVALRRLGTAPPDTLVRAGGHVVSALEDPAALYRLCHSTEPLVAGAANALASYYWEADGNVDAALEAARRALDLLPDTSVAWMNATARCRVAELCLQLEQGVEARDELTAALPVLQRLGAPTNAVGTRSWLVLANLQIGDVDEAERWLDGLAQLAFDQEIVAKTAGYDAGVRAEVAFARGDTERGLQLWRRAVDLVQNAVDTVIPHELDPWVVEARAVAVVAHARHGHLDRIRDVADALPGRLVELLTDPPANPPPYLVEQALCGTLLRAIATADLARGDTANPARMIALAERFRFLRNFQPTMSARSARADAERADATAYHDAVAHYAGHDRAGLRAAALALLAERRPA
ncbi:ATP-binding protein [Cryptosporangium sp. NPDC048952]|uniref:ATP-binding protein n=1 Tax=Cryptosporangium sp. NPDC048952 TaxID=3363961 RepID=UPI0037186738